MSKWRGKAIGGSIGSFFGPLGALAGAAAGHYFVDRKTTNPEKAALRLLALTAAALYQIASVDKHYTSKKDRVIRSILSELNQHLKTRLAAHELAYLIDDASRIDNGLARLALTLRNMPELSLNALIWLWRVTVSNEKIEPAAVDCIFAFAHQTGHTENDARNASLFYIRNTTSLAKQPDRHAYTVLEIPCSADTATIRRAYRRLSLKYHPDHNRHLEPDIHALTVEKFTQIKNAYDLLINQDTQTHAWVAQNFANGQLVDAAPLLDVRCFLCNAAARLPSAPAHLDTARCEQCQALLAVERELAEQVCRKY